MLKIKRLVVWVLCFTCFGVLYGNFFDISWFTIAALAFVGATIYKATKYPPLLVVLVFFVVGCLRINESNFSHTYEAIPDTAFTGRAIDVFYTAGGNRGVMVRGRHPVTGTRVRVLAYLRPFQPRPALGSEITVFGELLPLGRAINPGGYDQFRHLRPQGVDAFMWPDSVWLGNVRTGPLVLSRRARDRLAFVYDTLLPAREAGVVKAMVLGDRSDLEPQLTEMYRTMGIFHILSISGLHVAILMTAIHGLLGKLLTWRRAAICAILVMVFYCFMTGAAVPTVRAVLMCSAAILGKLLYRDYDLICALSWAAVVLVVYEPLFLWSVGFQLSFGAVFGIAILKLPLERLMGKLGLHVKLRGGFAVGMAAVMSTYVIFSFHFYEINTYSLLGNMVIAPTVTLLLVLGLFVGLLGIALLPLVEYTGFLSFFGYAELFFMSLLRVLAGTLYFILRFYEMSAVFFSSLPLALFHTGGGSLLIAGAYVLVLACFAYWFSGFGVNFNKRRGLFFLSVVTFAVSAAWQLFPIRPVVTPLDTEGGYTVIRHLGDNLVIGSLHGGERDVVTYMDRRGIRAATLVITETPTPANAWRLAAFEGRVAVLYLPQNMTAISKSLLWGELYGRDVGEVRFLGEGEKRVFGGLNLQVGEVGFGEIEVEVLCRRGNKLMAASKNPD